MGDIAPLASMRLHVAHLYLGAHTQPMRMPVADRHRPCVSSVNVLRPDPGRSTESIGFFQCSHDFSPSLSPGAAGQGRR